MGIKDNFDKALNKAIEGPNKMEYKQMLKNGKDIESDEHDCEKVHPDISHEEWLAVSKEETTEATGAGSSGGYVGPLFATEKKKGDKKEEVGEATSASSSGQYSTPQFLAKNPKNWKGAKKPMYKGGKMVTVKDKCKTYPYCNQGDINALNLTENESFRKAINEVSKKTGKGKDYLKGMIKGEIEEIIRRGYHKSPITDLVDVGNTDKPIGKVSSITKK
jgi:hypothetical protein